MTPILLSIQKDEGDGYLATFVRENGEVFQSVFVVSDADGIPLVNGRPDIFTRGWDGDAESQRSVCAVVIAFDRARRLLLGRCRTIAPVDGRPAAGATGSMSGARLQRDA